MSGARTRVSGRAVAGRVVTCCSCGHCRRAQWLPRPRGRGRYIPRCVCGAAVRGADGPQPGDRTLLSGCREFKCGSRPRGRGPLFAVSRPWAIVVEAAGSLGVLDRRLQGGDTRGSVTGDRRIVSGAVRPRAPVNLGGASCHRGRGWGSLVVVNGDINREAILRVDPTLAPARRSRASILTHERHPGRCRGWCTSYWHGG